MPQPIRTIIFFLILISTWSTATAETRVENGAAPSQGVTDLQLTESWRAGGEDDDVFFGNVLQVESGPDGLVYVLDVQLVQIFVYSAEGELLRTLGRRGEGPGEVNNANSMLTLADGRIGLGQVLPGKLVMVDGEGEPAGTLRITDPEAPDSGFVLLMGGQAHHDFLVLSGMRWRMGDGELIQDMFLRRYGLDGAPAADYFTKAAHFDATCFVFHEAGYDFVWNRFGIDPQGQVVVAPHRNDYEIRSCGESGEVSRVVTRSYHSLRRDEAALRRARLNTEALGSQYGRTLEGVTVEPTEPDIVALSCRSDGSLWVRTSRGDNLRDPGVLTTIDVFDPDGNFMAQRRLLAAGDPARDGIHLLADGRVVVVSGAADAYRRDTHSTTDEAEGADERPLEVICYQPGQSAQW